MRLREKEREGDQGRGCVVVGSREGCRRQNKDVMNEGKMDGAESRMWCM